MAISFQNDFFSVTGQKERLANAGNTLLSAIGIKGGGVQSSTGVKVLDSALSTAATHPFLTAGAAAAVINPAGALATIKAGASEVSGAFSALPLGQKAAVTAASLVVVPAVANSSQLRKSLSSTPSALVNFGSNLGNLADNPTGANALKVIKENPAVAAIAGVGLAVAGGLGVAGLASTAATFANTQAVKKNNEIMLGTNQIPTSNPLDVGSSSSPVGTPILAPPFSTSIDSPRRNIVGGARRRKRKVKIPERIVNNVKVYNIDDRDNIDRKVYKQKSQYA